MAAGSGEIIIDEVPLAEDARRVRSKHDHRGGRTGDAATEETNHGDIVACTGKLEVRQDQRGIGLSRHVRAAMPPLKGEWSNA